MKKTFYLGLFASTLIVAVSSFTLTRNFNAEDNKPAVLHYQWFKDPDLTEATGTWGEINTEVNRLMDLFPGYLFTAEPSPSLIEFEYGRFPNHPPVIIFSNRYPDLLHEFHE